MDVSNQEKGARRLKVVPVEPPQAEPIEITNISEYKKDHPAGKRGALTNTVGNIRSLHRK